MSEAEFRARAARMGLVEHPATTEAATEGRDNAFGIRRWNRAGDQPLHHLASTPLVAWAEWLRHQEIELPQDLAGVSASLWAVLIPAAWAPDDLPAVELPLEVVLGLAPEHQRTRLAMVDQLKQRGAHGLKAPAAALHRSEAALPCSRVSQGTDRHDLLPNPAEVLLLWCPAGHLVGWCCVPQGRPGPELLPLVRREGRMPG